jgi:hypothetical protein
MVARFDPREVPQRCGPLHLLAFVITNEALLPAQVEKVS